MQRDVDKEDFKIVKLKKAPDKSGAFFLVAESIQISNQIIVV
jgi:hypothetical protein